MKLKPRDIIPLMEQAYRFATESPERTQNAAILLAWNGDWDERYIGRNHPISHRVPSVVTHAEEDAIMQAVGSRAPLRGGTMICPWACCDQCAKLIIQSGVTDLWVHKQAMDRQHENWADSIRRGHAALNACGVRVHVLDMELERPMIRWKGEPW